MLKPSQEAPLHAAKSTHTIQYFRENAFVLCLPYVLSWRNLIPLYIRHREYSILLKLCVQRSIVFWKEPIRYKLRSGKRIGSIDSKWNDFAKPGMDNSGHCTGLTETMNRPLIFCQEFSRERGYFAPLDATTANSSICCFSLLSELLSAWYLLYFRTPHN